MATLYESMYFIVKISVRTKNVIYAIWLRMNSDEDPINLRTEGYQGWRPSGEENSSSNTLWSHLCQTVPKSFDHMLIYKYMGVCKNPAPIRLVFHDPPWAIFSFHSKKW